MSNCDIRTKSGLRCVLGYGHSGDLHFDGAAVEKRAEHAANSLSAPEPAPKPSTDIPVWDLVVNDMKARDETGARKYGVRLTAGDGRKSLIDAYQEALDLVVYLRKEIWERHGI